MELYPKLLEEFQNSGFVIKAASMSHINELEREIATLHKEKLLDEHLFKTYRQWLNFDDAGVLPGARTIIVIACPQLATKLNFECHGKRYTATLPPNYTGSESINRAVQLLNQVLKSENYCFKATYLPEKLLAARTGLGMYGRNNICYVNGMGSFFHLLTFYTDMPCADDNWTAKAVMPECSHCRACIKACPTQCISVDRFLIHAEKCLTGFNEQADEFPDWLDQGCHNAIVGCMKCQVVCPKNRDFINQNENEITFRSEETELILAKTPFSLLPLELQQKLDETGLAAYYNVMPRNLTVLMLNKKYDQ